MTHTVNDCRHDTRLYFRYDAHPDTTFSIVVPENSTVDDLRPLIRDTEELECDPAQISIFTPDGLEVLSDHVTVHDLLQSGGRNAAVIISAEGTSLAREEESCFIVQIHEQSSLEESLRVSSRINSLHVRFVA
ncbi:hypothetical protein BC936DRAFT_150148 [Jimgerdemannia flammicorona]|uniref:Uncharacterized protein n=1 Tax=Jimgerdemannia flammicorona TaxID=994334 RepID=A0A433CZE3_9FUNG|nr:hypothetical protein BC936DRAFT_150148 [Jimgerdemannia flammicorona]